MVIRPKALSVVLLLAAVSFAGAPIAAAPVPGTLVQIVPVIPNGLSFPIGATHAGDGSGRLFIVEQTGQIRVWDGTQLLATPFLSIPSLVGPCPNPAQGCGERGLLGLAFHPDYENNGLFYVYYTRVSDGDIVVARYENPQPADNVADPGSGLVLLTIEHSSAGNHNGGQIAFGPGDGYLYIATGDGGGGGDPFENGQDLNELLGKILRIDVDGDDFPGDANRNYAIPPNPFAGATPGADEIWAFGLRNPWRFSFDRLTGDLYIGDVGQGNWEEIDFQPAGHAGGINYGWDCREGAHDFNDTNGDNNVNCGSVSSTDPILEYNHRDPFPDGQLIHCSVTGGFVSRSLPSHSLFGDYIYADICSGYIWRGTETSPDTWSSQRLFDTSLSISSFGESESGRLYVVNIGGNLHWFAPYTFTDAVPTYWAWPFIEAIYGAEITAGCTGGATPSFCPGNLVTRAQMAIFLLKGIHGPGYQPPPAQGDVFDDVQADDFAAAWIEQLFAEGITAGCGGNNYCPNNNVTRAEMAIFLLRSKHGSAYTPPAAGSSFSDVANDDFAQDWIEQLFNEGITGGCDTSPLRYCPDNATSRAEMAVFLSRTFALPLP